MQAGSPSTGDAGHHAGLQIRKRDDADFEQLEIIARRVQKTDRYPIYLPDGDFRRFLSKPASTAARQGGSLLPEGDMAAPQWGRYVGDLAAEPWFWVRVLEWYRRTGVGAIPRGMREASDN